MHIGLHIAVHRTRPPRVKSNVQQISGVRHLTL